MLIFTRIVKVFWLLKLIKWLLCLFWHAYWQVYHKIWLGEKFIMDCYIVQFCNNHKYVNYEMMQNLFTFFKNHTNLRNPYYLVLFVNCFSDSYGFFWKFSYSEYFFSKIFVNIFCFFFKSHAFELILGSSLVFIKRPLF